MKQHDRNTRADCVDWNSNLFGVSYGDTQYPDFTRRRDGNVDYAQEGEWMQSQEMAIHKAQEKQNCWLQVRLRIRVQAKTTALLPNTFLT